MQDRLFVAAADIHGEAEVRRLINEEKVDVNASHPQSGKRAVELAAQSGSLGTLKFLIAEAKADITADQTGYTLFYWSLLNTPDIYHYLSQIAIYPQFNAKLSAVMVLAIKGDNHIHRDSMETHITEFTNDFYNILTERDAQGHSAVYWATLSNQPGAVDYLFGLMEVFTSPADLWMDMYNGYVDRGNLHAHLLQFVDQVNCYQAAIRILETCIKYHAKQVYNPDALVINETDALSIAELYYTIAGIQFGHLKQFKEAQHAVTMVTRWLGKIHYQNSAAQQQSCSHLTDQINLALQQADVAAEAACAPQSPVRGLIQEMNAHLLFPIQENTPMQDIAPAQQKTGKARFAGLRVITDFSGESKSLLRR